MKTFKAGAGCGIIRFPVELFPFQGFKGIHDDPHIRILYMEREKKWVLAAFEIVMLPDSIIDECRKVIAKEFDMDAENVWIHMTHAITTPHAPGGPGNVKTSEKDAAGMKLFFQALLDAIREATEQAALNVRDALLGIGKGRSFVNCNRDVLTDLGWWIGINPDGPSNRDMTVIKVADKEEIPLAFLINYSVKPCVLDNSQMSENERLISSDMPGYACTLLEEKYGVPVLFIMSAAADQIPRKVALYDEVNSGILKTVDLGIEAGFEMMNDLGSEMAHDADKIICEIKELSEPQEISILSESFRHTTKPRMELKPRKEVTYEPDGETDVLVSSARIGDIVFVGVRPELNFATEAELLSCSPFKYTLIVSLLNGGMKYMPDELSYDRITNEAQSSMLMPGAAEKFVDMAERLLEVHLKKNL